MSPIRGMLDAEDAGRATAGAYLRDPSILQSSQLGAFSTDTGFWALVLRRSLLALDLTPKAVSCVGPIFGRRRRGQVERFLRDYAYWRGVRRGLGHSEDFPRLCRGPIILTYHGIGREAPSRFVVPQRRFRHQMAWLKWRGYRVLSLSDLLAHRRENRLPPARSVILTFDDGYADNWELAVPVLRRYGFPATVFLVSGALGRVPNWTSDPALAGRPLLTISQVRQLIAGGMEIGAHTRSHPSLTDVDPARREAEVVGSRRDLERQLGRPVRTFAYPFGDSDREVQAIVEHAGYEAACSTHSGINDPSAPSFALRRIEVRGTDSLLTFSRLLWRGERP